MLHLRVHQQCWLNILPTHLPKVDGLLIYVYRVPTRPLVPCLRSKSSPTLKWERRETDEKEMRFRDMLQQKVNATTSEPKTRRR